MQNAMAVGRNTGTTKTQRKTQGSQRHSYAECGRRNEGVVRWPLVVGRKNAPLE